MAEQESRLKISIIGAGNVATHLAPALARVANVRQIISRHTESAESLAAKINSTASPELRPGLPSGAKTQTVCRADSSLDALLPDSDLYIIAATDDSIAGIASSTPDFPGLWVHTSGSVPISVFEGHKRRYGSLYPLQTFSKSVPVDVRRVPFFIESNSPADTDILRRLLSAIADRVQEADSERRKALHIAAVFACNFANQMWAEADTLLKEKGLDITFLLPLLEATLGKLSYTSPEKAMTGPARRGDLHVIESHIAALPPDLAEVYSLVTRRILSVYHPDLVK